MNNRTVSTWFAAIVAALTLSMVTSVNPADAAPGGGNDKVQLKDSGWNRP